jgi:hypothetical protein
MEGQKTYHDPRVSLNPVFQEYSSENKASSV